MLWVEGFWVEQGDRVRFELSGPDGAPIVDRTLDLEKGWRRWFQFMGDKRPGERWPAGTYAGEVTLERAGIPPATIRRTVELR